jgi:ABC-type uncharacterized transport system substrate-binding protein
MVDGLRELGYVEGQNLEIVWRLAAGKRDLIPEMAAELVRLNVDVIVAPNSTVASMVKQATRTIPIVAVATHDGVGTGLYASLAHPGDSITGLESLAPELDVKRVQFLKEMFPKLSRLAVLYNPLDLGANIHPTIITAAARTFGIETELFEVRSSMPMRSGNMCNSADYCRMAHPSTVYGTGVPITLTSCSRAPRRTNCPLNC